MIEWGVRNDSGGEGGIPECSFVFEPPSSPAVTLPRWGRIKQTKAKGEKYVNKICQGAETRRQGVDFTSEAK